ncbi:MAG: hypothetical protein WBA07_12965, partial [Rivularia sp. (in: cyanobacteria)]
RSWRSQRLLHVSYTSIKITQSTILPQKTFARGLLDILELFHCRSKTHYIARSCTTSSANHHLPK